MESIDCPFCSPGKEDLVIENALAYARFDKFPVNPGHMLIIPFRHFASLFEARKDEIEAMWEMIQKAKNLLDSEYSPDGYNIGVNGGAAAGQTVMHLHVHVIPRYVGDVENPRGGVRGVIPERRVY